MITHVNIRVSVLGILKNNIFIDNLQIYWNELFFASVRYVFTEQPNVDWAFKTSFVKENFWSCCK